MELCGNPRTGTIEELTSQGFRLGLEIVLSPDGCGHSWVPDLRPWWLMGHTLALFLLTGMVQFIFSNKVM